MQYISYDEKEPQFYQKHYWLTLSVKKRWEEPSFVEKGNNIITKKVVFVGKAKNSCMEISGGCEKW